MSSVNTKIKTKRVRTHEGALVVEAGAKEKLKRTVMACMLWEDSFYEDGQTVADRIKDLVPKVKSSDVVQIAIDAREKSHLRHVPLLIARIMATIAGHKKHVSELLARIIQRPDELTEFLSIYWKDGRQPLSAQVKKGLAKAFGKFNEYTLAKYNQDKSVKLRDVLFLTHPPRPDKATKKLYDRVIKDELKTPDTWEVELSASKDKKASWERLLAEKKLGGMALLRNLRNMTEQRVNRTSIKNALAEMKTDRILPFRFIAAAKHAVDLEPEIEAAMLKCLNEREKLPGTTVLLVDVSGSMDAPISAKSDLQRLDAACGLAILARELCESVYVLTFSDKIVKIPARRGFALRDAIVTSQTHSGTYLGKAISAITTSKDSFDRVIVITDEQSADTVPSLPKGARGYIINVAAYQNGVGYGSWTHINGWSESVFDFIQTYENDK